jgi:hypothetical protein
MLSPGRSHFHRRESASKTPEERGFALAVAKPGAVDAGTGLSGGADYVDQL